jgi:hypothetical protein
MEGPPDRKETSMKVLKIALAVLVLVAAAYPQTKDLGMGAFSNESGAILMAVDASLVNQSIDTPYAMFVLFMAANDKGASLTVAAKDVIMVYKGKEYRSVARRVARGLRRGHPGP